MSTWEPVPILNEDITELIQEFIETIKKRSLKAMTKNTGLHLLVVLSFVPPFRHMWVTT